MSLIPVAFYRAQAIGAEFGVSPNKGTDFVRVTFQIIDGEYAGQQIYWDGYFGENSAQRTVDSLRYCGCTFPNNDITNLEGLGTQEVSLDVQHESFTDRNGMPRTVAKVAWVNQLGGVKQELQMDAGRKASFRQRMMGVVHQAKSGQQPPMQGQQAGQRPAQQQQPRPAHQRPAPQSPPPQQYAQQPAHAENDDIPF